MSTALETTFIQCLLVCIYIIQMYQESQAENSDEVVKYHTG